MQEVEPVSIPFWPAHIIENRRKDLKTIRNEKSISEGLIAPILMAVQEIHKDKISVYSGEPLVTDELSGICEFLITRDPKAFDPKGGCPAPLSRYHVKIETWVIINKLLGCQISQ